ncbi:Fanconi anemia group G protein isoform X2 [Thalassophryne amazonica]|uniref:Fanconi anemia group G protein isoform X2 n=1 Tax=Thalassophryne amazonica TaxID=390379 RepID=UPI0014718D0E|nr:Fanconi anemia group G protein isoform X2 [Thalassophryne amazonica]
MFKQLSLFDKWIQENNDLVNQWTEQERRKDASSQAQCQNKLRWFLSEFQKLSSKIQGVPAHADHTHLDLTVVYNVCVYAVALSQFSEAEVLLVQTTERALQMSGCDPAPPDPPVFWRTVVKALENSAFRLCILHLFSLQWAILLATCRFNTIKELQVELSSLCEILCAEVCNNGRSEATGKSPDIPQMVMDPRGLTELLKICTFIAQGAENLSEGRTAGVLSDLHRASSLPAPRVLVAYTHLLSGLCLAQMSRPQMALQCYRKALETDSRCLCALYQSMLSYRHQGNTQAEIQALHLLHSMLLLPPAPKPAQTGNHLLSSSLLLRSSSLSGLLSVPSAHSVLHTLALKCVLHGRVSEGVEHYLDLLAALHSEEQHKAGSNPLPRLPELYLQAGAALLMARRPADCMALCDEVISVTLELLPQTLVLEEPDDSPEGETGTVCIKGLSSGGEKMWTLFWAAAAYLLQGHCYTHLKDWKQAVTHYTRCINLLVKVRCKKKGSQPQIPSADMIDKQGTDVYILQRLKVLSLSGRGISFAQTDQLKEALRDLHLSLQAFPECVGAGLWCGDVLWRLGRRQEATACWEKTWSLTVQPSVESLPLYLHEPQSGPLLDSTELRCRMQDPAPT